MSRAILVGAGIVGTSAALELARRGWKVRVFDPLALGVKAEVSGEDIEERVSMMNRLGVRAELLGARELQKRFSHLRVEKREPIVGIYEPESGYVAYARGSVEDLHEAAEREGVRFHFGERIRKIDTTWKGSVREVTGVRSTRRYRADVVLN